MVLTISIDSLKSRGYIPLKEGAGWKEEQGIREKSSEGRGDFYGKIIKFPLF